MMAVIILQVRGMTVSAEGTYAEWKKTAITYPAKGQLVAAGGTTVEFNQLVDAVKYEVYVDDVLIETIEGEAAKAETYTVKYRNVEVAEHKAYVAATLQNGTKVSSNIRNFYISKKGLGIWQSDADMVDELNASWYYNWSPYELEGISGQVEFVPMIWGAENDPRAEHTWARNQEWTWLRAGNYKNYPHLLAFNEPDLDGQAEVTPERAVELWEEFEAISDEGIMVGSPAVAIPMSYFTTTDNSYGVVGGWFGKYGQLMAEAEYHYDFTAVHIYLDWPSEQILEILEDIYKMTGKPIWITEWGIAGGNGFDWEGGADGNWQRDKVVDFVKEFIPAVDKLDYVERYAWFPFDGSDAVNGAGGLFFGKGTEGEDDRLTAVGDQYKILGNPEGWNPDIVTEDIEVVDEVDKTELLALIDRYKEMEQGSYTEESWKALTDALAIAKEVAAKEDATLDEVCEALRALQDAADGLQEKEDDISGNNPGSDVSGNNPSEEISGLWAEDIEDLTYTGMKLQPVVTVYDGNTLLKLNKDYTVKYKNNRQIGTAAIIITGKGNYKESITKNFNIVPKDLTDEDIVIDNLYVTANKPDSNGGIKAVTPNPIVKRNGKSLKKGIDYTIILPDKSEGAYCKPGTYTVTVEAAKGSGYTGSRDITITISGAEQVQMSKIRIGKIANQIYTGSEITPDVVVKQGSVTLIKDTDYTVTYKNNTKIGTATVIVTGTGTKYVGVKTETFQITGEKIKTGMVTGIPASVEYTGNVIEPAVVIEGLKAGEDYTVEYQNNTKVGKAIVVVTGINGYAGTVKKTFKITPFDISLNKDKRFEIISKDITADFAKGGSKPAIDVAFNGEKMAEGTDYTLSYKNNKKAGNTGTITIKGKGRFKGTVKDICFTIEKQDLANLKVSAQDILVKNVAEYNKVKPVIVDLDGRKLKKGTDYAISGYTKEDGSAITEVPKVGDVIAVKVKATENSNYKGETVAGFRVIANDKSVAGARIKVKPQTYTGKEIKPAGKENITVEVKVKENNHTIWKLLVEGEDYEIIEDGYSRNINKGTAKLTIHGINDYGGTKTGTFKITAQTMNWADWYRKTASWLKGLFH